MSDGINNDDSEEQKSPNYILAVAAIAMLLTYFLVSSYGNSDWALPACIYVGIVVTAIKLRWDLREHPWFWVTIVLVLLFHIPLVVLVPFPHIMVNKMTLWPIGAADGLITLGIIGVIENLMAKSKG